MKAADIMSGRVIAINQDAPLSQAVHLMLDNKISGLPVLDHEGRPVGMLTEGDLLRRVETGTESTSPGWFATIFTPGRLAGDYIRTHGRRVAEVMTPELISVEEDAPLADVITLMQRRRVKRVPVLRNGRIIGIVSRSDLLRVLGDALRAPAQTSSDSAIRERIEQGLLSQPWAHRRGISVEVRDGVVLLDGCVFDLREREAMRVLAENVPGVRRVENRLMCVEPNTGILIYAPEDEPART